MGIVGVGCELLATGVATGLAAKGGANGGGGAFLEASDTAGDEGAAPTSAGVAGEGFVAAEPTAVGFSISSFAEGPVVGLGIDDSATGAGTTEGTGSVLAFAASVASCA